MQSKKLAQIKQQIAKLEREAEKVRKAGIKGVLKQIKSLMEEHGISLSDLGALPKPPNRDASLGVRQRPINPSRLPRKPPNLQQAKQSLRAARQSPNTARPKMPKWSGLAAAALRLG